jgi:hypothetical protein
MRNERGPVDAVAGDVRIVAGSVNAIGIVAIVVRIVIVIRSMPGRAGMAGSGK